MTDSSDSMFIHEIPVDLIVELGRARLTIKELSELEVDEIVELDRASDSPLDVIVGGKLFARGEVVMVGERLALRITELVGSEQEKDAAE